MPVIPASYVTFELTSLDLTQRIAELEAAVVEHKLRLAQGEKQLASERQQRLLGETLYRANIELSSSLNY
jgi:hypothetical protein